MNANVIAEFEGTFKLARIVADHVGDSELDNITVDFYRLGKREGSIEVETLTEAYSQAKAYVV